MMDGSVGLGTTRRGRTVRLNRGLRETHVQVIGASGRGKSRLLEDMIRQDINWGRGLCLIDPHGSLYDGIVRWCAANNIKKRRRIHLINPAEEGWTIGFNPLRLTDDDEPSVRVDAMVKACAQVWGGEDSYRTPLLRKCLRALFYALAVKGLTLIEAIELTTATNKELRTLLTRDIPDPVFRTIWEEFNALSAHDFSEQFSSTNNRLLEFLSSPVVRTIVGQREHVLDLRQCMDRGEIVLVNLGGRQDRISRDNARLLGTLLVNDLLVSALGRDEQAAKAHPFYLYIDECYRYLNADIEEMLDQTRKFGLHLVLAHQRIGQLRAAGDGVYNAVMTGAQTKIVFGGLEDEDAEVMAKAIFRAEFNLEQPKHTLDKMVPVGQRVEWLLSEADSESDTTSWNESSTSNTSEGSSENTSRANFGLWPSSTGFLGLGAARDDPDTDSAGRWSEGSGSTASQSSGESQSSGSGGSYSTTRVQGRHQTIVTEYALRPTQLKSLDELIHEAIVKLKELPQRAAIVKMPGRPSVRIKTFDVQAGLALPRVVSAFTQEILKESAYISPVPVVEQEITQRHERLQALASERRLRAPSLKDRGWG